MICKFVFVFEFVFLKYNSYFIVQTKLYMREVATQNFIDRTKIILKYFTLKVYQI